MKKHATYERERLLPGYRYALVLRRVMLLAEELLRGERRADP